VIGESLYIVGGQHKLDVLQDAWTIELDDKPEWRRIKLHKAKEYLKMRIFFGHTTYNKRLYLTGGTNHQNLSEVYNDVLVLDSEDDSFTRLETEGEQPPALCRHSMVAQGGSLWLTGGFDGKSWLDTTYRLDLYALPKPRWSLLEVTGFTPWRRSHCCLLASPTDSNALVLFGGGDGDADFDDAHYLLLKEGYWGRVTNITGESSPRTQMGCGLLPPGSFVDDVRRTPKQAGEVWAAAVFGGYGGEGAGRRLGDFSVLALDHRKGWHWGPFRTSGQSPVARMGHSMHVVNDTTVVIFGGTTDYGADKPTGGASNELWVARPNKLYVEAAAAATPAGEPAAIEAAIELETEPLVERESVPVEGGEPPRAVVREIGAPKKKKHKTEKKSKKKRSDGTWVKDPRQAEVERRHEAPQPVEPAGERKTNMLEKVMGLSKAASKEEL